MIAFKDILFCWIFLHLLYSFIYLVQVISSASPHSLFLTSPPRRLSSPAWVAHLPKKLAVSTENFYGFRHEHRHEETAASGVQYVSSGGQVLEGNYAKDQGAAWSEAAVAQPGKWASSCSSFRYVHWFVCSASPLCWHKKTERPWINQIASVTSASDIRLSAPQRNLYAAVLFLVRWRVKSQ